MGTQQQLPLPGAGSVDLPEVQARLGEVFAKASAAAPGELEEKAEALQTANTGLLSAVTDAPCKERIIARRDWLGCCRS